MKEDLRKLSQKDLLGEALVGFKRALINIDYTNDFVHDKGTLTCGKPAQDIEDELVRVTQEAIKNGDYVVLAVDYHEKDDKLHPETKLFPQHNIVGTWGRELYGKLNDLYLKTFKNSNVDSMGVEAYNLHYADKVRYSAFVGNNLEVKLRERGITVIDLVGVCTDICVLHTAIDAYNKGFKVRVHSKAVASFDPIGHEYALRHMKNVLGAEIL